MKTVRTFIVAGETEIETTGCEACEPNSPCLPHTVQLTKALQPKPKRKRRKSLQQIAAEACGLVKVRGALGGVYFE